MNIEAFISKFVTKRNISMFAQDIERYANVLSKKIQGKQG